MKIVMEWNEFRDLLDQKFILLSPFCGRIECEDEIRKKSTREEEHDLNTPTMGAKTLCIPFEQVICVISFKN